MIVELQKILAGIRKADEEYHLIEDGDKIAVGISGGKDSMVLLSTLSMYSRFKDKHFSVIGIHIEVGFEGMDFTQVEAFCKEQQIEFYSIPSKIYGILNQHLQANGKLECSLCSKLKKGAIVQEAKRLGCNKLAFGHHGDDAIETLFLNMIHGGRIASFPPIMHLSRENMSFIRPMIYCFEDEVIKALHNNNIPFVVSTCPNDGFTQRQDMKEMLASLYEQNPQARSNFLLALHNPDQMELWDHEIRLPKSKK